MANRDQAAGGEMIRVGDVQVSEGGLTKREYAAIQAMNGLLSTTDPVTDWTIDGTRLIAEESAILADALFDELEKEAK